MHSLSGQRLHLPQIRKFMLMKSHLTKATVNRVGISAKENHRVAFITTAMHDPESVHIRPSFSQWLAGSVA